MKHLLSDVVPQGLGYRMLNLHKFGRFFNEPLFDPDEIALKIKMHKPKLKVYIPLFISSQSTSDKAGLRLFHYVLRHFSWSEYQTIGLANSTSLSSTLLRWSYSSNSFGYGRATFPSA